MGDKKFYMTYAGRTYPDEIVPWVEENQVPIMTNVQDRWSEAKEEFLEPFEYKTDRTIDSSGYNSQGDYVDQWGNLKVDESVVRSEKESDTPFFPWTLEQYHTWLSENKDRFTWAATMDYACEERFNTLWSVEDRIEATIENTIEHFDYNPDYKLVPVLQGRSVDDYMYCYERFEDAGVDVSQVGLGTVCRISSETRLVEMEQELRSRLSKDTRVHGFGVKVNAFKLGASFDTADSHAWVSEPRRGRVALLENDGGELSMNVQDMKNSARTRTIETFKTYYAYVSKLLGADTTIDVDEIRKHQKQFRN